MTLLQALSQVRGGYLVKRSSLRSPDWWMLCWEYASLPVRTTWSTRSVRNLFDKGLLVARTDGKWSLKTLSLVARRVR